MFLASKNRKRNLQRTGIYNWGFCGKTYSWCEISSNWFNFGSFVRRKKVSSEAHITDTKEKPLN